MTSKSVSGLHQTEAWCREVCISLTLQSDRHHQHTNWVFTARCPALPAAQPTVSKHWRRHRRAANLDIFLGRVAESWLCCRKQFFTVFGDESLSSCISEHIAENSQHHQLILGLWLTAQLSARVLEKLTAVSEVLVAGGFEYHQAHHVKHWKQQLCRQHNNTTSTHLVACSHLSSLVRSARVVWACSIEQFPLPPIITEQMLSTVGWGLGITVIWWVLQASTETMSRSTKVKVNVKIMSIVIVPICGICSSVISFLF